MNVHPYTLKILNIAKMSIAGCRFEFDLLTEEEWLDVFTTKMMIHRSMFMCPMFSGVKEKD